ncbi:AraC family transcriptional regulator [Flexibacterium corallicola]|uniref:AraC family transcriptional regulator n=1 Tax=Flexibacterium corallicola TaxID=3037259 RepID=UPI00286F8F2E|nr:helix-turn-helix transcriptional regulator [Pseudovibrio sp. M1P-2-3]
MKEHPEIFTRPSHREETPIIAYAIDMEKEAGGARHCHERGQLLHILSGTMTVTTDHGSFVVPPERAVWMPVGVFHETSYMAFAKFRTLYVCAEWCEDLPQVPQVIQVTPLLRELIMALMGEPRDYEAGGPVGRLARVLVDQMAKLPVAPLQLTFPTDDRLKTLAKGIVRCPSNIPQLAEAATSCALSQRTFERRFSAETGLSFRSWCNQAKLFRALELLAVGRSVGDVAHKLGYEGPSAFIHRFKTAFGVTPGQYFRESHALDAIDRPSKKS